MAVVLRKTTVSRFTLVFLLFLALAAGVPHAGQSFAAEAKQKISPVCAKPDFVDFLEAYVLVSKEEQMSCIQFSEFTYKGKRIANPKELLKSNATATKLVFSRQDISGGNKADQRFFYVQPVDMVKNGPAHNSYCYMIRSDGNRRYASLTSGGTFPLETVGFFWDGNHWRVVSVVEEDMQ